MSTGIKPAQLKNAARNHIFDKVIKHKPEWFTLEDTFSQYSLLWFNFLNGLDNVR